MSEMIPGLPLTANDHPFRLRGHSSLPEMEVNHLFLSPFMQRRREVYGPPSANQGLSTAKPRLGHAVFTLWGNPPTSPCPRLSAHAVRTLSAHSIKWHNYLHASKLCPITHNEL